MRIISEKVLSLDNFDFPETLALKIENEAEKMKKDGWFYSHSSTDELMENIVLFFEREE
ncbi:hypothetical protein AGMMS49938_11200 [Fibrobacterales bacterium]|nr:hypothetical protein AGMMS49938_11200 [Fibrobacterales bacterium]